MEISLCIQESPGMKPSRFGLSNLIAIKCRKIVSKFFSKGLLQTGKRETCQ